MRRRLLTGTLALGAALALALGGCSDNDDGGDKGTIKLGMFNFDELIAITNLWAVILEDKGYDVEMESADKAPVFQGLADGSYDAVLSIWTSADSRYIERYGDDIVDLGTWNDEASLTIAVNADAPIDSLDELAENADEFDNRLVGIEAGASLTSIVEEEVIPTYGLEGMEFVVSSTPTMLTELEKAMSADEPIAVTLWRPHWAYGAYDLKDLEDPEGALGEIDTMNVFGSSSIEDDHPEVAEWLSDFEMDTDRLHDLENRMFNENEGEEDFEPIIREWIADNQDYVDSLTD